MPPQAVTPLKPLRAAVSLAGAHTPANERPPPLPSMRVPKGTHREQDDDSEREWSLRAAEVKARLQSAEEREWAELVARTKAAQQEAEEAEWKKLRERALEATREAEESEWAQLARARSGAPVAAAKPQRPPRPPRVTQPTRPASESLHPFDAPPRPAPKPVTRIVQWP